LAKNAKFRGIVPLIFGRHLESDKKKSIKFARSKFNPKAKIRMQKNLKLTQLDLSAILKFGAILKTCEKNLL
jgi:hypothetical protein